jgi:hypothetical protein
VESDLDYSQIIHVVETLFTIRKCPIKGLIWVIRQKPISIGFDETDKLRAIVRELFQGMEQTCKIAIVTASAFHSSIITCFLPGGTDLPFELKTFTSSRSAFEWISADKPCLPDRL